MKITAMSIQKMQSLHSAKKQQGNYLLSIGIGIMIMAILAVWGIPKVQDYLIEGALPSVAEETQRFVSRLKVNISGAGGSTPYKGVTQEYFARTVRGSVLQVTSTGGEESEDGEVVRHGLGGGGNGIIEIAEVTNGTSLTVTFSNVNHAACPGLATALQRTFDNIKINDESIKVTDPETREVTDAYLAGVAADECENGDTNEFIFEIF